MNPLLATMVTPAAIRTTTISLTGVSVQNVSFFITVSPTVTNSPRGTEENLTWVYILGKSLSFIADNQASYDVIVSTHSGSHPAGIM